MPVRVRIYNGRVAGGLFWEFPSTSKASDFVKELAEWELQREYTKKYISDLIYRSLVLGPSVLNFLGINVVSSKKCGMFGGQNFNDICCVSDSDSYLDSDSDSDSYLDSDSDSYLDSDTDSEFEAIGVEKVKCQGCGRHYYDIYARGCYNLCKACEVEFAEDPFGMFS